MPETLEDLVMLQPPTAERPLLGPIVLVVEDSRHACEGLRLICQRSGARIRRAESLASAERHLRTYRPRITVVDLGLPDGSGLELIAQLSRAEPRIEGIIATSGDETLHDAAIMAGADVFLPKPLSSISDFQQVVLKLLPADLRPVQVARSIFDRIEPDPIALRDDLSLVVDLLRNTPSAETLDYVAGFLTGLAKNAGDTRLAEIADALKACRGNSSDMSGLNSIVERLERSAAALELV